MSGFSEEWLSAREPVDHAARGRLILNEIARFLEPLDRIKIADIGTGTGSTLRAIQPVISRPIDWHVIDNDKALLDALSDTLRDNDAIKTSCTDLAVSTEPVFQNVPDLVTTSAFLDLVSKNWLSQLVAELALQKKPFYAALTYDGRTQISPCHPLDHVVLDHFNRHQKTDKGFGPSLGPGAAQTAIGLFEEAGFSVLQEPSDWVADFKHNRFQEMLLEGWRDAVVEIQPELKVQFNAWYDERLKFIADGSSKIRVGHIDFFAVPKA